jgi:hypothetical protein
MRLILTTPFKDLTGTLRTALDLRDVLTGGDILFAQRQKGNAVEQGYHIIARVAGLDLKEVEEMDVRDIAQIDAHIVQIQAPPESADPKAE